MPSSSHSNSKKSKSVDQPPTRVVKPSPFIGNSQKLKPPGSQSNSQKVQSNENAPTKNQRGSEFVNKRGYLEPLAHKKPTRGDEDIDIGFEQDEERRRYGLEGQERENIEKFNQEVGKKDRLGPKREQGEVDLDAMGNATTPTDEQGQQNLQAYRQAMGMPGGGQNTGIGSEQEWDNPLPPPGEEQQEQSPEQYSEQNANPNQAQKVVADEWDVPEDNSQQPETPQQMEEEWQQVDQGDFSKTAEQDVTTYDFDDPKKVEAEKSWHDQYIEAWKNGQFQNDSPKDVMRFMSGLANNLIGDSQYLQDLAKQVGAAKNLDEIGQGVSTFLKGVVPPDIQENIARISSTLFGENSLQVAQGMAVDFAKNVLSRFGIDEEQTNQIISNFNAKLGELKQTEPLNEAIQQSLEDLNQQVQQETGEPLHNEDHQLSTNEAITHNQINTPLPPLKDKNQFTVHKRISDTIDKTNLPHAQKKLYKGYVQKAVARMPKLATARLSQNLTGQVFYGSVDELNNSLAKESSAVKEALIKGRRVLGTYRGVKKEAHLDGGINENVGSGVYAHEFCHAIDGPNHDISKTKSWNKIFEQEIDKEDNPLSSYARKNPHEALAEFGRLVYVDGDLSKVEQLFPKATAYWKHFGLWPDTESSKQSTHPNQKPVVSQRRSATIEKSVNRYNVKAFELEPGASPPSELKQPGEAARPSVKPSPFKPKPALNTTPERSPNVSTPVSKLNSPAKPAPKVEESTPYEAESPEVDDEGVESSIPAIDEDTLRAIHEDDTVPTEQIDLESEEEIPNEQEEIFEPTEDTNQPVSEQLQRGGELRGASEHGDAGDASSIRHDRKVPPEGQGRIVTSRPELTRPANPELVPEGFRQYLKEMEDSTALTSHQVEGVYLGVESMDANDGFILADSTGVGKTRQELVIGKYYLEKGMNVLLVTPPGILKRGNFGKDSESLKVPLEKTVGDVKPGVINLVSFNKLKSYIDKVDANTVVIYDEAHSIRNIQAGKQSMRSQYGKEVSEKAGKVLYASATPIDLPFHLPYLFKAKVFGDRTQDEVFAQLGLVKSKRGNQWSIPKGKSPEVMKKLEEFGDELTKRGVLLQRGISLEGIEVGIDRIKLSQDAHDEMKRIEEGLLQKQEEGDDETSEIQEEISNLEDKIQEAEAKHGQVQSRLFQIGKAEREGTLQNYSAAMAEKAKLSSEERFYRSQIPELNEELEDMQKELKKAAKKKKTRLAGEEKKNKANMALIRMQQRRVQEKYKIEHTVKSTLKELEQGRKVVIFAARVNPIEVEDEEGAVLAEADSSVEDLRRKLQEAGISSDEIVDLHGGVNLSDDQKADSVAKFNRGNARVIIATIESGGTGIDLDDQIGDSPRSMIVITPPVSGADTVQAIGRVWRLKSKSYPKIRFIFSDTEIDRWNAACLMKKLQSMKAVFAEGLEKFDFSKMPEELVEYGLGKKRLKKSLFGKHKKISKSPFIPLLRSKGNIFGITPITNKPKPPIDSPLAPRWTEPEIRYKNFEPSDTSEMQIGTPELLTPPKVNQHKKPGKKTQLKLPKNQYEENTGIHLENGASSQIQQPKKTQLKQSKQTKLDIDAVAQDVVGDIPYKPSIDYSGYSPVSETESDWEPIELPEDWDNTSSEKQQDKNKQSSIPFPGEGFFDYDGEVYGWEDALAKNHYTLNEIGDFGDVFFAIPEKYDLNDPYQKKVALKKAQEAWNTLVNGKEKEKKKEQKQDYKIPVTTSGKIDVPKIWADFHKYGFTDHRYTGLVHLMGSKIIDENDDNYEEKLHNYEVNGLLNLLKGNYKPYIPTSETLEIYNPAFNLEGTLLKIQELLDLNKDELKIVKNNIIDSQKAGFSKEQTIASLDAVLADMAKKSLVPKEGDFQAPEKEQKDKQSSIPFPGKEFFNLSENEHNGYVWEDVLLEAGFTNEEVDELLPVFTPIVEKYNHTYDLDKKMQALNQAEAAWNAHVKPKKEKGENYKIPLTSDNHIDLPKVIADFDQFGFIDHRFINFLFAAAESTYRNLPKDTKSKYWKNIQEFEKEYVSNALPFLLKGDYKSYVPTLESLGIHNPEENWQETILDIQSELDLNDDDVGMLKTAVKNGLDSEGMDPTEFIKNGINEVLSDLAATILIPNDDPAFKKPGKKEQQLLPFPGFGSEDNPLWWAKLQEYGLGSEEVYDLMWSYVSGIFDKYGINHINPYLKKMDIPPEAMKEVQQAWNSVLNDFIGKDKVQEALREGSITPGRSEKILLETADAIEKKIGRNKKGRTVVILGRDAWPLVPLLRKKGVKTQYFLYSRRQIGDDSTKNQWMKEIPPHSLVIDTGYEGSILKDIHKFDPTARGMLISSSGWYPQIIPNAQHSEVVDEIEHTPKLIGRSTGYRGVGTAITAKGDYESNYAGSIKKTIDLNSKLLRKLGLSSEDVERYKKFSGISMKERIGSPEIVGHLMGVQKLRGRRERFNYDVDEKFQRAVNLMLNGKDATSDKVWTWRIPREVAINYTDQIETMVRGLKRQLQTYLRNLHKSSWFEEDEIEHYKQQVFKLKSVLKKFQRFAHEGDKRSGVWGDDRFPQAEFEKSLPFANYGVKRLDGKHDYGCLLTPLPDPLRKEITDWTIENIPEFHLTGEGRELRPHVTVVYGFEDSDEEVSQSIKMLLARLGPISIELGDLGLFTGGKDGDVLYVEVESPELHKLHDEIIQTFDVKNKFPVYKPHVTLAYLDPEFSHQYVKDGKKSLDYRKKYMEYDRSFSPGELPKVIGYSDVGNPYVVVTRQQGNTRYCRLVNTKKKRASQEMELGVGLALLQGAMHNFNGDPEPILKLMRQADNPPTDFLRR
jgi:2'-5' RNA ligase